MLGIFGVLLRKVNIPSIENTLIQEIKARTMIMVLEPKQAAVLQKLWFLIFLGGEYPVHGYEKIAGPNQMIF